MKRFFKSTGFRCLLLLALVLLGTAIYIAAFSDNVILPEQAVGAVLTPVQTASATLSEKWGEFLGRFGGSDDLSAQNAALQEEINRLRQQQVMLDEIRRENEWYRHFLELKEQHPDYQFVSAGVIAADPADHFYNFTVNVGTRAGVQVGDPVITPDGMVGVVCEVGATYAKVRTLLDPETSVSVIVSRTGDNGITQNTVALAAEGRLRLTRLDRTAGAVSGDFVVTFGNGKYPAGLLLGELCELYTEPDGLSLSGVVRPFADVSDLRDVFIIVGFDGAEG